jgi:urease accessory protein
MLVSVPVALTVGASAALVVPMPASASGINLFWMPLLGVLVASAPRLPSAAVILIAVVPALTIGWANGGELGSQVSAIRFIPGIAVCGLLLTAYGAGGIRRLQAPWMSIAIRVLGSWIAAVGVMVISLR